MINKIKYILKKPLKLIGEKIPITVKYGPLRGYRILAVSPIKFFKGTYEKERTEMFLKIIKEGDIFYDIGAHFGFYSLIASQIIGDKGKIYAFEPHPYNLKILRKHIELNNITNVVIISAAVSDKPGKAKFAYGTGTGTGHLSEKGDIEVDIVSIDDLIQKKEILPPSIIKIDVEGAEILVLKGAWNTITLFYPVIFLAAHSIELLRNTDQMLLNINYKKINLKFRSNGDIEVLYLPY
jgi:FkbM family methyltransferase